MLGHLTRRPLLVAFAAAGAAVVTASAASSPLTPGTLDPTFGQSGAVITQLGSDHPSDVTALLPLEDGAIVAAGVVDYGDGTMAGVVARYREDGSLDESFATAGVYRTGLKGPWEAVLDLARQPGGKIVGVGYANQDAEDEDDDRRLILLFRLDPNGRLDPTFGDGGVVTTDLPGTPVELGVGVETLRDGRILVAGQAGLPYREGRHFVLLRYSADGVLDRSFGPVHTAVSGRAAYLQDVAVTNAGSIVAVGVVEDVEGEALDYGLIARYSARGRLDARFGTRGLVRVRSGIGSTYLNALAVQPNGRIVVAGGASVGRTFASRAMLFRYDARGRRDRSFGSGGAVLTQFRFGAGWSAILASGDKLLAAGFSWPVRPGPSHFALARYRASDGALDRTFGAGGTVESHLPGTESSHAYALAVDRGGRLLAAGGAFVGDGFRFALARYSAL